MQQNAPRNVNYAAACVGQQSSHSKQENQRLLNVKLHGSGKRLPISLLVMINRG